VEEWEESRVSPVWYNVPYRSGTAASGGLKMVGRSSHCYWRTDELGTYGDPTVEAEQVIDGSPDDLDVVVLVRPGDERLLPSLPVVGHPERDLLVKQIRTIVPTCRRKA
jgi:hypothetical protein